MPRLSGFTGLLLRTGAKLPKPWWNWKFPGTNNHLQKTRTQVNHSGAKPQEPGIRVVGVEGHLLHKTMPLYPDYDTDQKSVTRRYTPSLRTSEVPSIYKHVFVVVWHYFTYVADVSVQLLVGFASCWRCLLSAPARMAHLGAL